MVLRVYSHRWSRPRHGLRHPLAVGSSHTDPKGLPRPPSVLYGSGAVVSDPVRRLPYYNRHNLPSPARAAMVTPEIKTIRNQEAEEEGQDKDDREIPLLVFPAN